MDFAEIAEANDKTIQKAVDRMATEMASRVIKKRRAAVVPAEAETPEVKAWSQVKAGSLLTVGARKFLAMTIDPTRKGGEFAWVTGYWMSRDGKKRTQQISHLHCTNGQRMELMNIGLVQVSK